MGIITYPLDGKYYNAQDAETYLCTRTSGVFSQDISFTPNGMNITVSPFLAWIKNDDFSGKSVAVTTDTTLTISPSEPILSRIDRIVLRFDARKNGSELMVLKGTPSSSPAVPSIERTPVIYDLCLCQIAVKPSATSISAGDITSTLLDESLCGIMRDGVTGIPTNQLVAQCQDLIKELNTAISMAENGSPVLQSLGIKRGTITMVLGEQGEKIYKSGDISFDVPFLSAPTVVVTRCAGITQDDTVAKYVKPQESVYVTESSFNLSVYREVTGMPAELRYNWIAIGKVSWDNDGGGGGDGGGEEDDTEYFTITTSVDPLDSGITEGAGNFAKGSKTTLVARAFSGYMFEGWYSGNSKITSNAEYTVTVNSNATYTAKFIEAIPDIVVQINVDPVGTGTVSGAGTYKKGSTINLGATPKDGYKFVGWYVGNTKYASTPDYSVTLNASTTFTARFEEEVVTPDYYTVFAKVTPTGSGTVTGGGQYVPGATAKLKATANEGYVFSYWSSGTETINSAEFTFVVSSNRTWTAHFIEGEEETGKVTITTSVEPANSGTVTGGGKVTSGSMSAVQANANSGYNFKHWRFENGTTNTENPYLFRANADRTFVAVFEVDSGGEETTYTADTIVDGTLYVGTQTTNIETNYHYEGASMTEIVIPEGRTTIAKGVFGNCTRLTKVTMPSTMASIGANAFGNCINLTEITYNGTKSQWNNVSMDRTFDGLTVLTVHCTDGDVKYVKVAKNVSPANAGTITTSPAGVLDAYGKYNYVKGSSVTFTATANSGYVFSHWSFSDDSEYGDNPCTKTVNQDITATAVFVEDVTTTETAKLYIYSSNAGTGDVVKLTKDEAGTQPWNKNEFSEGETAYFFAQAGTGRTIERLVFKIDNVTVADMTADEMVEEGILNSDKNKLSQQHYVAEGQTSEFVATVYFGVKQQSTHTVTTRVSPEGAGSTTGGGSYTNGSSATLSATANEGYMFSHWEYDVGGTSNANPVRITVKQDVVGTAVFMDITNGITYKITSYSMKNGDTLNLYPSSDGSLEGIDYSNPLGTTKVLYAGDDTFVCYYAKAGENRSISYVDILENETFVGSVSKEDLSDYFVDGALNIPAGFYDPEKEGTVNELVVYFGETVEKKTITFSSFYGTTKVVCNGVELSNSRDQFTHEFNTGDEITLTFTPDSGYRFSSWVNDDTASRLSDDNPWTFTVDSSTVRKIGITYIKT